MLDPTCPDITGRVMECLCRCGMTRHDSVRRAVKYLLKVQEKDGSWYGRWGVNYIYGSFLAMRGLTRNRKVFGYWPSPQSLKDPKSLYHGPSGTSGECMRHSSGANRSSMDILHSLARSKRCWRS